MNEIKQLRLRCLDNHSDLVDVSKQLTSLSGNEEFVDSLKDLGSGALSVARWTGGQVYDVMSFGVKKLGIQLHKVFDDNRQLSSKISGSLKEEGQYSIDLSASLLGNITSTGKYDDFMDDLDTLIRSTEMLTKHMHDVNDHMSAELVTARKLRNVKTSSDIMKTIQEFEKLTYPNFELPQKNSGWVMTHILPGGKVFKFKNDDGKVEYSMSGDKPAGETHTLDLSKSEIKTILDKINKLNEIHQKVKESYADYLDFVNSWSEMVKEVDAGLDKVSNVGSHIINEAEAILKGDSRALSFYSGFTPRVVNYVDKYIQDVLGIFSKVI